tara:strand:- start:405 stop:767 length:363 start_codon:yes stop_codon:yes gene_type:complete
MSFLKDVSAKSLYISNRKLLDAIFKHPPELKVESSSYFNRILQIHKIIKDDLAGTCTVVISDQESDVASILMVSNSLNDLEQLIFGEKAKPYNPGLVGCIAHTEYLLMNLQSSQNTCVLL